MPVGFPARQTSRFPENDRISGGPRQPKFRAHVNAAVRRPCAFRTRFIRSNPKPSTHNVSRITSTASLPLGELFAQVPHWFRLARSGFVIDMLVSLFESAVVGTSRPRGPRDASMPPPTRIHGTPKTRNGTATSNHRCTRKKSVIRPIHVCFPTRFTRCGRHAFLRIQGLADRYVFVRTTRISLRFVSSSPHYFNFGFGRGRKRMRMFLCTGQRINIFMY